MKIRTTLIIALTRMASYGFSQENTLEEGDPVAMIKSAIIFQFAFQSEWPDSDSPDFLIGVYGNDVIYEKLLNKYA